MTEDPLVSGGLFRQSGHNIGHGWRVSIDRRLTHSTQLGIVLGKYQGRERYVYVDR